MSSNISAIPLIICTYEGIFYFMSIKIQLILSGDPVCNALNKIKSDFSFKDFEFDSILSICPTDKALKIPSVATKKTSPGKVKSNPEEITRFNELKVPPK
jgi:hypothetical protein